MTPAHSFSGSATTYSCVPPLDTPILAVTVPAAPLLAVVDKTTPKYLETLYRSAAKAFWPLHEVKPKLRVSKGVWQAAAGVFKENATAPATYLEWAFSAAVHQKKPRVSPLDAVWVFDPETVAAAVHSVQLAGATLRSAQSSILDSPYLRDLRTATLWLQREARTVTEPEAQALATSVFPEGWEAEYAFAAKWVAVEQKRLDAAVDTGEYIWGKV